MASIPFINDPVGVLLQHRRRVLQIVEVLARFGFADLASRIATLLDESGTIVQRYNVAEYLIPHRVRTMSTGERMRHATAQLGTTFIKLGQLLSVRPDIVGSEIAAELAKLQVDVPADPDGYPQQLIEEELGAPLEEIFSEFDPVPLGSGSVAQTHRARLRKGNRPVAVKLLHSGVRAQVKADVELINALVEVFRDSDPDAGPTHLEEIAREFDDHMRSAVNLSKERRNMERLRKNFQDEPDIIIPSSYPEYCTDAVLTMDLMEGQSFDPDNLEASDWTVDDLVSRVTDAYLSMIFRDGFYHADPHPGNFFFKSRQRIVIMDFGEVGVISRTRGQQLTRALLAIQREDAMRLARILVDLTHKPHHTIEMGPLSDDLDRWMQEHLATSLMDIHLGEMLREGMQILHDYGLYLPGDIVKLLRVLILLQGMAHSIGARISVTDLLQPYLVNAYSYYLKPQQVARRAIGLVTEWTQGLENVPANVRDLIQAAKDGNIATEIRVKDPDDRVGMLVDGIITSALIVVSGQMFSSRVSPVVKQVSVPGAIAAGLGAAVYRRLRKRDKNT